MLFDKHFYKSISLLKDIQASSIYISNIRFYKSSINYFNSNNISPLLHFWSLSIENQFYLLYPIVYFFTYNIFKYIILFILIVSYSLLCINYKNFPEFTYYLLQTRIWELLIGCLSFLIYNQYNISTNYITYIIHIYLVLVFILLSVKYFSIPGPFTVFPTLFSSIVCINNCETKNYILTNILIRFIGKISYSLYLFHYPFVSLPIDIKIKSILIIIMSIFSYYVIEITFQNINNIPKKNNFLLFFLAIGVINYIVFRKKQIKSKVIESKKYYLNKSINNFKNKTLCNTNSNFIELKLCNISNNLVRYILWGDSHLYQYINIIKYFIHEPTFFFLFYIWHMINNEDNKLLSLIKRYNNIEMIYIGFLSNISLYNITKSEVENKLNRIKKLFFNYCKRVVYIQDNPYLFFDPINAKENGYSIFQIGKNASLTHFLISFPVIVLNPFSLFCPNSHICNLTYNSSQIYADNNHINTNIIFHKMVEYFALNTNSKILCKNFELYLCDLREFRFIGKEAKYFSKINNINILYNLYPTPQKYVEGKSYYIH